jgi:hypothetical protein
LKVKTPENPNLSITFNKLTRRKLSLTAKGTSLHVCVLGQTASQRTGKLKLSHFAHFCDTYSRADIEL